MAGQGAAQQGLNTAIASGSAFGGGHGGSGPGTVYTIGAIFGKGLGEGGFFKSETSLFTGELGGGSYAGLKGFGNTGWASSLFDAVAVGAEANPWAGGTAGDAGADDSGAAGGGAVGSFGGESGDAGDGGGDDGSNHTFSAIAGLGAKGFKGAEELSASFLGALFPDPTPSVGGGRDMGMEMGG